jgi:hypothetical protein
MLVSQTPGGLYEHFFEEVGKPVNSDGRPLVSEDQPDVGRIVEVAGRARHRDTSAHHRV